ncbi:phytoene desaturase [Pseudahrensia aquimaris]|uniref:Phytoene desaturase n=1 Tax=Pseudahrensia aquimaris TaxID=744461 RepID=A0ABW3FH48_9HYPH
MTTHPPHKQFHRAEPLSGGKPHAIVIGAGFGGLAAAVRLGVRGYRVTVLEKLEQAGGRASVFRQDGFTFDAGPTIITAPFILEELWTICGKRMEDHVKLAPMDPFYRIRFDDGTWFTCNGDADFMRSEIARFNPDDVKGYEMFFEESKNNYSLGFGLMDRPFHKLIEMLKFVPELVTKRADRTVYGHVAKHIKNEKLRQALSFHPLFVGGNPMNVTSVYSLIAYLEREYGVHFAWGGTGALVQGMVDLIEDQGSKVRTNAPVAELMLEGDKAVGVKLNDGEEVRADVIVSNADSNWVYRNLLPKRKKRRWTERKLDRTNFSMSLFVWYLGTDKRFEDVDHHTILMGPRYGGLLKDIFKRKVLADDFSLYLHRPTATDPSLAPEGCDTFYVLSPVPHLDADVDWETQAEPYRRKIEAHLEKTIMPGLADSVVTSKIFTPLDFRDRLNAPNGAAFGPEPLFTQSGWFRPHNVSEEVENFYLVGATTHPGAGVPGVVTSAKVLDSVIPHADEIEARRATYG